MAQGEKINVFVSILPQVFFAERVGGSHVDVNVMVGPGQNPATYEPTPKQMTFLSKAKVYFRIGVPFENAWINRLAKINPRMKIADLRQGIELLPMRTHYQHSPEDEHGHHHGNKDPHIWLNPQLAKTFSKTICDTLKSIDPAHKEDYQDNLNRLVQDLDKLDREISEQFKKINKREFLVFHPAWGYFAEAYDLEQIPVELEGKEPTAKQLTELIQRIKSTQIKVIFVQEQFSRASAQAIARAIAGQVIAVDPLAKDYLKNMKYIAQKFSEAMQ